MNKRLFSEEDQLLFAELSGDSNPLHVDALQARRTLFGRQVIHGIHLLLWSLQSLLTKQCRLNKLNVTFRVPVGVGEPVSCRLVRDDHELKEIVIESRGVECASIQVAIDNGLWPLPFQDVTPPQSTSKTVDSSELHKCKGNLDLFYKSDLGCRLLGDDAPVLPPAQIALLLATTRLVGMECPGTQSIYSQIALSFHSPQGQGSNTMNWRVEKADLRFGRISIKIAVDGCDGTLVAFVRPTSHQQLSFKEVSVRVRGDLFRDQIALIIGGSRGIGEVCAKVLAAGGATAFITYRTGAADAEAVVSDIRAGGAKASTFCFDVLQSEGLPDVFSGRFPTHVYYFATPPIFVAAKQKYSSDLFLNFYDIYVRGLMSLYDKLRALHLDDIHFYYPSSVAVAEIQNGMGEYAAAKAAGETLCRYLATIDRKIQVHISRLPRIPTDQTASLLNVPVADAVEILLKMLTQENPAESPN